MSQKKILKFLIDNPNLSFTTIEIADAINCNRNTTRHSIDLLRRKQWLKCRKGIKSNHYYLDENIRWAIKLLGVDNICRSK